MRHPAPRRLPCQLPRPWSQARVTCSHTGHLPGRRREPPHLLLHNLSAASEGACPPGTLRGLQSQRWGCPPERRASQSHSVSMGAATRAPPAPTGWRRRRCRCCRVTCWRPPSTSVSAPRRTAGRPHSTRRLRPHPRPGGRQPLSGLRKTAAGIPGRTPRSGRLGSCS